MKKTHSQSVASSIATGLLFRYPQVFTGVPKQTVATEPTQPSEIEAQMSEVTYLPNGPQVITSANGTNGLDTLRGLVPRQPGERARQRRLRQMEHQQAKQAKREHQA